MINLLPSSRETIVLPCTQEEVTRKISQALHDNLLTGNITGHTLKVSARVIRPTQFQPVITGTIEGTSRGCILFIQYQLLASTKVYLVFWSILSVVAGCTLSWLEKNILYVPAALVLVVVFRWIAHTNLLLQRDAARKVLLAQLS